MKRFLVSFFLLINVFSVLAQNYSEEFHGAQLEKGSTLAFVFDYTDTKFKMIFTFEEYLAIDPDFAEDLHEAEMRYVKQFSLKAADNKMFRERELRVQIIYKDPDYRIIIHPYAFNEQGSFVGEMKILDREDNVIAVFQNISAEGGAFGSYTNLIGDGYENNAKKMVPRFARAMKKGYL